MKTWKVEFTEVVRYEATVKAHSDEEADEKVQSGRALRFAGKRRNVVLVSVDEREIDNIEEVRA